MPQTLRKIVSDLATDCRAANLDDRISFRYLANKFRDKFAYFLRLDARSREIFKQTDIWRPIFCIEFEDVPVTTCGNIGSCYSLKRSTIKLPDYYSTNFGALLKLITINGLQEFTQLTQSIDYQAYIDREYSTGKPAFWIENGYIYVPNTTIDAAKALIVPKDPIQVDKLNKSCPVCTSPLDAELNYPDYLITVAKQEIIKELIGGYKQVVEDEKGDDNTNNKQ